MVDTWATVGSCAQIGKNCHLSGGTGIGGVLEPLQAGPVIIEDNCFIGARAEVAEGVVVREGSVLSMGVYLGASTKIIDRATGEVFQGEVPPYSVVVSGTMPGKPMANGAAGPEPLLRRDRQARRREDPLQDQHQRIAAGLIHRRMPRVRVGWRFHPVPGGIDSSIAAHDRGRQWIGVSLFFKFNGRINRAKFWLAVLVFAAIYVVLAILGYVTDQSVDLPGPQRHARHRDPHFQPRRRRQAPA